MINWGACINEDAINKLSIEELEKWNKILEPYENKHIFTVTDGTNKAKVYREYNGRGHIICDNYPEEGKGLIYWDCYDDVIDFVCDYNPKIDKYSAWLEDTNGNELFDEYEED